MKPFFARYLEGPQELNKEQQKQLKGGDGPTQTSKYPSDSDEA